MDHRLSNRVTGSTFQESSILAADRIETPAINRGLRLDFQTYRVNALSSDAIAVGSLSEPAVPSSVGAGWMPSEIGCAPAAATDVAAARCVVSVSKARLTPEERSVWLGFIVAGTGDPLRLKIAIKRQSDLVARRLDSPIAGRIPPQALEVYTLVGSDSLGKRRTISLRVDGSGDVIIADSSWNRGLALTSNGDRAGRQSGSSLFPNQQLR